MKKATIFTKMFGIRRYICNIYSIFAISKTFFLSDLFSEQFSEFVKIIDGNGTEVLYHLGCMSFAPEILADVPFGVSKNISIQIYTLKYGNSIKMKYAILKEGLASGMLTVNAGIILRLLAVLFQLLLLLHC